MNTYQNLLLEILDFWKFWSATPALQIIILNKNQSCFLSRHSTQISIDFSNNIALTFVHFPLYRLLYRTICCIIPSWFLQLRFLLGWLIWCTVMHPNYCNETLQHFAGNNFQKYHCTNAQVEWINQTLFHSITHTHNKITNWMANLLVRQLSIQPDVSLCEQPNLLSSFYFQCTIFWYQYLVPLYLQKILNVLYLNQFYNRLSTVQEMANLFCVKRFGPPPPATKFLQMNTCEKKKPHVLLCMLKVITESQIWNCQL